MNWLLIIVLVILAAYTIRGYQKGLLRVLFSLFSLIITIAFVTWATPYISNVLKENTQIYQKIQIKCEEKVKERMQEKIAQEKKKKETVLENYGITLPEHIEESLIGKIQKGADYTLEKSGIYEEMAKEMADFINYGIAFFAALIICAILMHFLQDMLDIVSKIPILKGVNKTLGVAAGLLQGLIIIWLFFYLLTLFQNVGWGEMLLSMIQESRFLTVLYENNILLYIITLFL